ncbi:MAG TPA: cbb3-type cytochrome c oxidase subunit I [Gemmatimonadaceae bacterium]|nr:cbb3-type cytochrome c oxidase subunit I [Gemmatimonadaceae bacterium]
MYTLVRRYIKTAIGFLAFGLGIGGWMIARRELYDVHPSSYVVSAHTHAIFVGFVMMMILGVALWLFPRPDREDTRYRPARIEWAYWLLTIGTAGRVAGELLRTASGARTLRAAILVFGAAQIVALLLFFHSMWSRIRPLGSRAREEKGERF